nr:hypothetical protein [uncultured Roseibium sp.]
MTDPCLELVVFKVKDKENARLARRAAQDIARRFEGFVSWTAYASLTDENLFADVVFWKDLDCAKAASEKIMSDQTFAALLAEIDGVVTMSHYAPDRAVEAPAVAA